jgi:hypothetical protein
LLELLWIHVRRIYHIHLAEQQAKAIGLPIIKKTTKGEKEAELKDLEAAIKEAIKKYLEEKKIEPKKVSHKEIVARMLARAINEAAYMIEEGICDRPQDMDLAMRVPAEVSFLAHRILKDAAEVAAKEEEVDEEYADKVYEGVGNATVGAVVHQNADSMFLPAVYQVREAKVVKGPQVIDIEEVVSYESLYGDMADVGETILVKGKLEHVTDRKNKRKYHRLIVGSPEGKGSEYVKLLT